MAESIPLYLAILIIMAIIIVLDAVLLGLVWFVSTKTTNRFLRAAVPVFVVLLGILWTGNYPGDIVATSFLFAAPMAVLIPPFLFPPSTGPETGFRRIVACYLVVSVFAALVGFYFVMYGQSVVPWIYRHMPFSDTLVYLCVVAVCILLASGVYGVMKRAGVMAAG
jgi:hypothetical protein